MVTCGMSQMLCTVRVNRNVAFIYREPRNF